MTEIDFGAVDEHGCFPHITELVMQLRDIWTDTNPGYDSEKEKQFWLNNIIEQIVVEAGVESTLCPGPKSLAP